MKLWIDDIRQAPSDDWTVARSISDAIRAINAFDFEIISIDHDISHQVAIGAVSRPYPCVEDFSAVCFFIGRKYKCQISNTVHSESPKIILHTSNPVGALRMQNILKDFGLKSEIKSTGIIANRLEMEI